MRRLIEVLAVGVTNDSGTVVQSGTVTFYDAGTSNLRAVYQDFAEATAHANPATLDAAGRLIAYSSRRLKLVIRDSSGATVRTIDNVGTADSDLTLAAASDLAGSGLTAPGDGTLAVNPDGTTLEISSDAVRVKDSGISTVKIADDAVTVAKSGPIINQTHIGNCVIACSVASNALTIALKTEAGTDPSSTDPVSIAFRSSTATSGAYNVRSVTSALSLVVSSGSTLGHTSASDWQLFVYAIDNSGTVELAVSSSIYDERSVKSTSAEGGAGGADSVATIYSTTARSNVPIRLIATLISNQTTAGTWAAVPTLVASNAPSPVSRVLQRINHSTVGVGGVGWSASSGNHSSTSTSQVDVTNLSVTITTSGRPVRVCLIGVGDGSGSSSQFYHDTNGASQYLTFRWYRDATLIDEFAIGESAGASGDQRHPVSSASTIDFVTAGTYTYKLQGAMSAGNSWGVIKARLVAYEL